MSKNARLETGDTIMMTKITMAVALAFAAIYAVPASASQDQRTCGYGLQHYDSSGVPVGPYCH
jgi:hypothetical protein